MKVNKNLITYSKTLRSNQTPWEWKLWYHLRAHRFKKFKFKRQVVINKYIVDFCCSKIKLIIELDGSQHKEAINEQSDRVRDQFLENEGYTILRFNNNDIDNNIEGVLVVISKFCPK